MVHIDNLCGKLENYDRWLRYTNTVLKYEENYGSNTANKRSASKQYHV